MAFSDPQSITISGSAHSLPRTGSGANSGVFTEGDRSNVLTVSSQYGKRVRQTARLDDSKIAPDPLISAQNIKYSMSAYLVIDTPQTGFTAAEAQAIVTGLLTWLTTSSGANLAKLLGGEN